MKVKLPTEFYTIIEEMVSKDGFSYVEAILEYSQTENIEIEVIANLVKHNQSLKAKLFSECEQLKMVKST